MSDEVDIGHKEPKAKSGKAFELTKSIVTVILASIAAAWISHHYKVEEENAALYAESRKAAQDFRASERASSVGSELPSAVTAN